MNVVIDAGNTTTKVGIFDAYTLTEKYTFASLADVENFLIQLKADNILISSVNVPAPVFARWVQARNQIYFLSHLLPLPIKNMYATPETLGVDRLAGACGAHHLFPRENCLVIDSGTCITYDFLDEQGVYHGGSIAPGINMRFQAMHHFTARLPLAEPADDPPLMGNNTIACMQSGVINGVIAEMNGLIDRYREKYSGLKIILCGGDIRFFEKNLKASIFAFPDLVLSGLNSILIYNVNI